MTSPVPPASAPRDIELSLEDLHDGKAGRGVAAISHALKTMPGVPGVYRMWARPRT